MILHSFSLYKQKWSDIKNVLPKKAELHKNRNSHSKCVSGLHLTPLYRNDYGNPFAEKPEGESRVQNYI